MAKLRRRKPPKSNERAPASAKNGDVRPDPSSSETPLKESKTSSSYIVLATACAVVGFFLYVNAVWECGFCYDDGTALKKNPDVLNEKGDGKMSSFVDVWKHDYWGVDIRSAPSNKSYRPLVILSFRVDALISREPWIFHLTNAILFAVSCWLVVNVICSAASVGSRRSGDTDATAMTVLLSGLWFASHPVHTEAVASLVGRAEVLAAIFCLLGVKLVYCKRQHKRFWVRLLAGVVCFFAACLCKETAVVLPLMLGAADFAVVVLASKHKSETTRFPMTRAPCLGMVSLAYLRFRVFVFGDSETGQTLAMSPVHMNFVGHLAGMDKLRTAIYIQAKYVQLLVWPGTLSCDYNLGVIEPVTSWVTVEMAFSALAATAIAAWLCWGLIRLRRTGDTTLLLALGWTFGPLIPASHIVGIGTVMAERLLFLPSIGVAMLICHVLSLAANSSPKNVGTVQNVLAICIMLFAYQTVTRNKDWESTGTLFAADIKSYPEAVKLLLGRARHSDIDESTAFAYATTVQRVLDRHAATLTLAPYPYAKRLMTYLKMKTRTWPEGANKTEALMYANQVIAMGNRFGVDEWGWIHEKKARALIDLAAPTGDKDMWNEAAQALKIATEHQLTPSASVHCLLGSTLGGLQRNLEAHESFQECSRLGGPLVFSECRNHAIALQRLSGVASNDAAAAKTWGKVTVNVIVELLAHPKELIGTEVEYWVNTKNAITRLMAESETDDDTAKNTILKLVEEADEAEHA